MSHPFVGKGGSRQQVADLCTKRIAEIDTRRRELITEFRRLGAERVDLESSLVAVGIETQAADSDTPAAPLRAVG